MCLYAIGIKFTFPFATRWPKHWHTHTPPPTRSRSHDIWPQWFAMSQAGNSLSPTHVLRSASERVSENDRMWGQTHCQLYIWKDVNSTNFETHGIFFFYRDVSFYIFFLDDLIDLIGQDAPPPSPPSLSYAVQCDMCVVVSASWWSSKHPLHNCRQPTLMGTCIYSCYAHIYPLFDFMSMFVQTYPSQMIRLEQLSSEL